MNVSVMYDAGNADGTRGGAELAMDEIQATAPEGVTLTDMAEADTVIFGNCTLATPDVIPALMGKRVIRFHHDLARHENEIVRSWLEDNAEHVFTSPIHRDKYGLDGELIPPSINLEAFKPNRQTRRHVKREGVCSVASWQSPGKGGHLISEQAERSGVNVDCYGPGNFAPRGPRINDMGPVDHSNLPQILHRYEQFLFLPITVEPFGRCVAEAFAAGCEVLTNDLVGAKWWIENKPESLYTAAQDFWGLVCGH